MAGPKWELAKKLFLSFKCFVAFCGSSISFDCGSLGSQFAKNSQEKSGYSSASGAAPFCEYRARGQLPPAISECQNFQEQNAIKTLKVQRILRHIQSSPLPLHFLCSCTVTNIDKFYKYIYKFFQFTKSASLLRSSLGVFHQGPKPECFPCTDQEMFSATV